MVRYIGGWCFSTWCIARKTIRYKIGPFKRINPFFFSFSFSRGEHSGAFIKILHCIQDHKLNAKQGWGGSELSLNRKQQAASTWAESSVAVAR